MNMMYVTKAIFQNSHISCLTRDVTGQLCLFFLFRCSKNILESVYE